MTLSLSVCKMGVRTGPASHNCYWIQQENAWSLQHGPYNMGPLHGRHQWSWCCLLLFPSFHCHVRRLLHHSGRFKAEIASHLQVAALGHGQPLCGFAETKCAMLKAGQGQARIKPIAALPSRGGEMVPPTAH